MTGPASRMPVWHDDGVRDIVAAVAELPLRARTAPTPTGAIAVVPGAGDWPGAVEAARDAGARAVVVSEPQPVPGERLAALRQSAGTFPVVLDRPGLRQDAATDAGTDPHASLYTAQCSAPRSQIVSAVIDALGWLRVLAGAPLHLHKVAASGHGAIALLTAGATVATLTVTALESHTTGAPPPSSPRRGRLSAAAFGVQRTEVELVPGRPVRVVHGDEHGALTTPVRWETRHRLALRRALDAVQGDERPADLDDFAHDAAIAAQVWPRHPESHKSQ